WLCVVPLAVHSVASFHCKRQWSIGIKKRREVDAMSGGDRLDFLDELRSDGAPSAGEGFKASFQRESDPFEQASVGHVGKRMTVQDSMEIGLERHSARDLSQPSRNNRGAGDLYIGRQVLRVTGIADDGVGRDVTQQKGWRGDAGRAD